MCSKIKEIKNLYFEKRVEIEKFTEKEKTKLEKYKNGIYSFYDLNNELLYIGMVSNANTASLYARMYGNGNAAHKKKNWFKDVNKVYFYQLNTTKKFDIMVLERILIRELNPRYNDLVFDDNEISNLLGIKSNNN